MLLHGHWSDYAPSVVQIKKNISLGLVFHEMLIPILLKSGSPS